MAIHLFMAHRCTQLRVHFFTFWGDFPFCSGLPSNSSGLRRVRRFASVLWLSCNFSRSACSKSGSTCTCPRESTQCKHERLKQAASHSLAYHAVYSSANKQSADGRAPNNAANCACASVLCVHVSDAHARVCCIMAIVCTNMPVCMSMSVCVCICCECACVCVCAHVHNSYVRAVLFFVWTRSVCVQCVCVNLLSVFVLSVCVCDFV